MAKKKVTGCPVPAGVLVIIGGKEDKGIKLEGKAMPAGYIPQEILKTFISTIGKKKPLIELVTSGSSEGDETFNDYKKAFGNIADVRLQHIHHNERKEALKDDLVKNVNAADGIFFSGGDQLLLTSLYGGTPFLSALKEKYIARNFVVAGTSAGAMAMSTPMIYEGNKDVQQIAGAVRITTGLEFLKDVCVDTHFVDRGRFVRMAQVIATNPTCIGIGIEEDTAIIVRNGSDAEIIGSGLVTIIEGFHLTKSNTKNFGDESLVSIHDLRVHLLSKVDKYQIPIVNPPHL